MGKWKWMLQKKWECKSHIYSKRELNFRCHTCTKIICVFSIKMKGEKLGQVLLIWVFKFSPIKRWHMYILSNLKLRSFFSFIYDWKIYFWFFSNCKYFFFIIKLKIYTEKEILILLINMLHDDKKKDTWFIS